jgi:hypothetical protein
MDPAFANGMVFVGSQDNNVYALNESTGAKIWSYKTEDNVASSPAVTDGVVFVGSHDNNVYALNESTGALIWNYTTGARVHSSPAVAEGVVFIGSTGDTGSYGQFSFGLVTALNESTGAKIWSYDIDSAIYSSPAVADGVVFIGSSDNNVYAFNASTGALIWSYTTGDHVHSSPAVANGVVYIGSNDGKVYAFGNPSPVITPSIPNQTKIKNADTWTLDLTAYETDAQDSGTDLDWRVSGVNSSLCSVTVTNLDEDILTFTPVANATGTDTLTLTLTDSEGATDTQIITLTITDMDVVIDDSAVSDTRSDTGSTQSVSFHASWENDPVITEITIYVNGTGYTTNSTGWASFSFTSSSVGKQTWTVTGVNCSGITDYTKIHQTLALFGTGFRYRATRSLTAEQM